MDDVKEFSPDRLIGAASIGDIAFLERAHRQGVRLHIAGIISNAAFMGRDEVVTFLLDHDGNVNEYKGLPLRMAVEYGKDKTVALLLSRGADTTLSEVGEGFEIAAGRGYTRSLALLLAEGFDVNHNNGKALEKAADNGKAETVALLLGRGADPTLGKGFGLAAGRGHAEVIQTFLEHGLPEALLLSGLRKANRNGKKETAALIGNPLCDAVLSKAHDKRRTSLLTSKGKATTLLKGLSYAGLIGRCFQPGDWKGHEPEALALLKDIHNALPRHRGQIDAIDMIPFQPEAPAPVPSFATRIASRLPSVSR